MMSSLKEILSETEMINLSIEELKERNKKALNELDMKRAEMHADVDLLYQLKVNEINEFYHSLIVEKVDSSR